MELLIKFEWNEIKVRLAILFAAFDVLLYQEETNHLNI